MGNNICYAARSLALFFPLSPSFFLLRSSLYIPRFQLCVHRARKKVYTRSFIHSIRNSDYYYYICWKMKSSEMNPLLKNMLLLFMLPKRNREKKKKLYNIIFHLMCIRHSPSFRPFFCHHLHHWLPFRSFSRIFSFFFLLPSFCVTYLAEALRVIFIVFLFLRP